MDGTHIGGLVKEGAGWDGICPLGVISACLPDFLPSGVVHEAGSDNVPRLAYNSIYLSASPLLAYILRLLLWKQSGQAKLVGLLTHSAKDS